METQPPPNSLLLSQEFLLVAAGGLLTDAEALSDRRADVFFITPEVATKTKG